MDIANLLASFWEKIISGLKGLSSGNGQHTGEEPPIPPPPKPKKTSRFRLGSDDKDCKCIHCHREFEYEDYLGLCTSKNCADQSIFREDIQYDTGEMIPDMGPRQILLRDKTASNIKSINEEFPIPDKVLEGNNVCPSCNNHFFFYACPHCRHTMPRMRKEIFDNMVAPAGILGSGKSVYMTALINQLIKYPIIKPHLQVVSRFSESEDFRRFRQDYSTLFTDKVRLGSTQMITPLPYLLSTQTRNPFRVGQ